MNLKNLNTAESFALVRVVSFPLVLYFICSDDRFIAAWLYIILFSTDFIDGFFAFFFEQESTRRAQLDTLGDILFLLVGVYGFYVFETEFFIQHIWSIVLIFGLYLTQLLFALIRWKKPTSFHTYTAKLAAIAQVIFLGATLLFEASVGLFYFALLLSVLDALEEIVLTLLLPHWKANIKGLLWYKPKSKEKEKDLYGL